MAPWAARRPGQPRFIACHDPDKTEGGFTNRLGPGDGEFCEDVIGRCAGFKDDEHGA